MNARFFHAALFAFSMLFAISCEGPRGPQGPSGEFIYNRFDQTILNSDWLASSDPSTWYVNINAPEITDYVLSEGFVLVYRRASALNSWTLLPDVLVFQDAGTSPVTTYSQETRAWAERGNIYLEFTNSHPTLPARPGFDMIFRIVTFDSMITPAMKSVDFKDYAQVEAYMKSSGTGKVREVMERR